MITLVMHPKFRVRPQLIVTGCMAQWLPQFDAV